MSAAAFPWVPEWLRIAVTLAMLAVILIVGLAALRAAAILLVFTGQVAGEGAERLTTWLSHLLIRLVLAVVAVLSGVLLTIARVFWRMARGLWARTGASMLAPIAVRLEAMRQRRMLRQLWEDEYRDQFPDFADFLDAFARSGKPREGEREEPRFDDTPPPGSPPRREPPRPRPAPTPPPPPDPNRLAFIAACRLLGVPESGEFTPQFLNARYRVLISAAHPDRGGSVQRAAALNAARDLIKSRKGWV